MEPSRYNDEPASRKRASGADSAHSSDSTAKLFTTPERSEHEHDVLASIVRVRLRDDDEAISVRLGELHLAERRRAGDAPAAHDRVARELGQPELSRADALDHDLAPVGERLAWAAVSSLRLPTEGGAVLGDGQPLLRGLLLHDRPCLPDRKLGPGPIGEPLSPEQRSVTAEAPQNGSRTDATRRLEDVHRSAGLEREVRKPAADFERRHLHTRA